MGCNCGGTADGFVAVWQFRAPNQAVREFATQAEAETARRLAGGKGTLLRIVKRTASVDGPR
jgi:hypothetical protein